MRLGSSPLLFVLVASSLTRAQAPTWTMQTAWPPALTFAQMVYDIARGRSVMVARSNVNVGVMDTWEWDGVRWRVIRPALAPPGRQRPALAFDAIRALTVMFGGGLTNDTWEWDGVTWLQRSPAAAPAPRSDHRMAFDIARARTVLFGGSLGAQFSDETWEWDGVNWAQRLPATHPVARYGHGMAYDLSRNRVVLYGGRQRIVVGPTVNEITLTDTWEWDGVTWTQLFPLHSPSVDFPAMVFDTVRARTLLYAGTTWTWDGIDWTPLLPPSNPTVDGTGGLAFDLQRQRAVLYGGTSASLPSPLTWEWDGSTWTEVRTGPTARAWAAMAYADRRGSALLFGGASGSTFFDDAWEWDGASWSQRTTATRPSARNRTAIVYDGLRDRYVMFGGAPSALGDTWELDRTDWIQRVTSPSPPARSAHAMAFDQSRGRVVLFGGLQPSTSLFLNDTWEWNGSSWTQRAPVAAPTARQFHAMTFDPVRGRTLLFGGFVVGFQRANDLWEWNGTTWQFRPAAIVPPARVGHVMTWDAARARAVVFGGSDGGSQTFADTWEWDGVNWTQAAPVVAPFATVFAAAAYDSQRGAHMVFGGTATQVEQGELWERATPGFAIASTFGSGCGTPPLTASPTAGSRPILGATQTIDIGNVPAGFAAMAYGFSMSAVGTTALPLDLGAIGMTGCSLLQSADSLFEPCASSGPATATYSASVPNLPSLLSLRVWLQAWAPAPGQNPAGLIASNAVSLWLGSQ